MVERKSSSPGGVSPGNAANEGSSFGSSATRRTTAPTAGEYRSPGRTEIGSAGEQESGIVGKVRERAAAQISTQKDRATDGLGSVAQAVRQSTQQLRDQKHETVAGYVEQAADQIERFSRRLKEKDVGELVEDAQRLARRQPALFVGSAFALGLVGARFFKSASPHSEYSYGEGGYGAGYSSGSYGGKSYAGSDYERALPSTGTRTSPTTSTTTKTSATGAVGSPGYRSPDTEKF